MLRDGLLTGVGLPVSDDKTLLYLEAVCPMELPERFRQEPTHHLRPPDELPQPMADREEPCRLVCRHPLAGSVFWTEASLLPLTDRAALMDPHHFVLWADLPTREVGGPEDTLDLYSLPEFFCGFSTHGRRETLTLFDASGHALPLPGGKILLCRALEEQGPPVRVAPDECTDHCTKTTDSHRETTPVKTTLPTHCRIDHCTLITRYGWCLQAVSPHAHAQLQAFWRKLGVLLQQRGVPPHYPPSSSRSAFASWRSAVSKPSVNQP